MNVFMKINHFIFPALLFISASANSQLGKRLADKVKTKTSQRADQKVDKAIDKGLDKIEDGVRTKNDGTANIDSNAAKVDQQTFNHAATDTPAVTSVAYKAYQNYDFVPGDKILFEDNFSEDQPGEFPAHWELQNGQAVVNQFNGKTACVITDGNYGWVSPLMKKKKYLGAEWTFEFDNWKKPEAYQIILFLQDDALHDLAKIHFNSDGVTVDFPSADGNNTKTLMGSYPVEMLNDNFLNKWHHIAIAYKNKQVKVYVDQVRAVVVPNCNVDISAVAIGGIASADGLLIFSNVRIAEGAGMNMLGKKFTDTKIITHGINFDVNKAVIKPESMGTLNGIVKILTDNPDVKFEVGGHTDGDGNDAANLKLSQARAEAVRDQLVIMGINTTRLTTKGYGESKPIADNITPEGKANNRRVEFVKK